MKYTLELFDKNDILITRIRNCDNRNLAEKLGKDSIVNTENIVDYAIYQQAEEKVKESTVGNIHISVRDKMIDEIEEEKVEQIVDEMDSEMIDLIEFDMIDFDDSIIDIEI
jgi:alcohol dehydrogenase class IV